MSQMRLTAYNHIPYALINGEVNSLTQVQQYMNEVANYYRVYKKGADFIVEGNNGDYVSSDLRYKLVTSIINKQARFMFANTPDVNIVLGNEVKSDATRQAVDTLSAFLDNVLRTNMVESNLLKGAKDCFIGGRIAIAVSYTEEGIELTFLDALKFVYETDNTNRNNITKFVAFDTILESRIQEEKRIFKKRYEMVNGRCIITDAVYDGAGKIIEEEVEYQTPLPFIPCVVINNDGLLGDMVGESEIETLADYESAFSKLSNADIDSGRKNMNPIRYLVDMNPATTKGLSSSAGSLWDLASDKNVDDAKPQVGMLQGGMNYSDALTTTLNRISQQAHDLSEVPNITAENMVGTIATGKGLKAIYWGLTVRCEEKMKVWKPQLELLFKYIIDGAYYMVDDNESAFSAIPHLDDKELPEYIKYKIEVVNKYPIPEDEVEEKTIDMQQVNTQVMSKKSYMKKWNKLTDEEADIELKQIALERQLLEDSYSGTIVDNEYIEEDKVEL